jgi:hypothetical protein
MCGGDGIDVSTGQKLAKPGVAQAARGFFDGLGRLACSGVRPGLTDSVYAEMMEPNPKVACEESREVEVGIGFSAAQTVMEVSRMQH